MKYIPYLIQLINVFYSWNYIEFNFFRKILYSIVYNGLLIPTNQSDIEMPNSKIVKFRDRVI